MNTAESAVAHHQQYIAGVYVRDHVSHDIIYAAAQVALLACCGDFIAESLFVQLFLRLELFVILYMGNHGEVCLCQ